MVDDLPPPPAVRADAVRLNPFFLLSALFMLGGLFALNGSLDWSPMPPGRLLGLIAVLNVYELCLLACGVWLLRCGFVHDGLTLLLLEAVFLFDVGFLNNELITTRGNFGAAVYVGLLVLAVVKLLVMFRATGMTARTGGFACAVMLFVLLGLIPAALKASADFHAGTLSPLALHGAWWVMAFVPVLVVLVLRGGSTFACGVAGIGVVALLAHVATMGFVHNVAWQRVNLSPLLIGLGLAAGLLTGAKWPSEARQRLQLVLPMIGVALAIKSGSALRFDMAGVALSPLRLCALAAAAVWLIGVRQHRQPLFLVPVIVAAGAALLGATPSIIAANLSDAWRWTRDHVDRLLPRTRLHWGVLAVMASFVTLIFGVLTTLRHGKETERTG